MGMNDHFKMPLNSIADALFTKTQQKVLGLLYGKPDKSFYTNEIMRWASMGRGTVSRELEKLVGAGLLSATREGNQVYFQANQNNPVFKELAGIVKKTFGVADLLRQAIEPFDETIDLAMIYGSIAKGVDTKDSDIDLMLVGESLGYGEIMERLLPLEASLGRSINPTIYSKEEFSAKIVSGDHFIMRVLEQPKIILKGDESEFRVSRQSG